MKKGMIAVTGADGFLGSNVVRALLAAGYDVQAILEPGRETGTLAGLEYEARRGSLLDAGFVSEAVRGADAVIHTAASTAVWPNRIPSMRTLNVVAAVELAREAKAAGVPAFVHVGSASSFAWGTRDQPGDEAGEYRSGHFGLDYQDTKKEAQDSMLALQAGGFRLVVVNPTFMFGPYDSKPGSGEMILSVAARKVPGYTSGGRSFADVRAVAKGIVAALERGRGGQCYILGGNNLSYGEAFSAIAAVVEVVPPRFKLPGAAALAYGAIGSAIASLTGKPPKLSLAMTRVSLEGQYYSSAKAERELGYAVGNFDDAVGAAVAWFKANGKMKTL